MCVWPLNRIKGSRHAWIFSLTLAEVVATFL